MISSYHPHTISSINASVTQQGRRAKDGKSRPFIQSMRGKKWTVMMMLDTCKNERVNRTCGEDDGRQKGRKDCSLSRVITCLSGPRFVSLPTVLAVA
jgi:hypothetical protein